MTTCVIAIGSNVGPRRYWLRRAVHELQASVNVVRLSRMYSTAPVDSPPGSGEFLNAVLAGSTGLSARELVEFCLRVEQRLGRRRGVLNAPRTIDIDVVLHGATLTRSKTAMIPHPRFTQREFVLAPLRELSLDFRDPRTGKAIDQLSGFGLVRASGLLFGMGEGER